MIRVTQLVIYPIKSCRGVEVDLATVGTTGFEHDRRWMLIGDDGRFLSQREHHRLALVRVQLDEDRLRLDAPGLPTLKVMVNGGVGPTSRVQVWDDECAAVSEGADAARWFSQHLGCSARLVRMASDDARPLGSSTAQPGDHVSFADGFPFLLLSTASLDGLNRRLSLPVPMDRTEVWESMPRFEMPSPVPNRSLQMPSRTSHSWRRRFGTQSARAISTLLNINEALSRWNVRWSFAGLT